MAEEKNQNVLQPGQWVNLYADILFNYAITRVNNHHIAKDLVQETFLSGLKGKDNFRGEASEKTWLISILKRKIIDHYRKINSAKGKKEVRMPFYQDGKKKGSWLEENVPQTWGNEAEKKIENEELKTVLDLCIEALPNKHKMVFLLKTQQNFASEEICNELDITSSNLWVIIHRARLQLRECIENNWFKK